MGFRHFGQIGGRVFLGTTLTLGQAGALPYSLSPIIAGMGRRYCQSTATLANCLHGGRLSMGHSQSDGTPNRAFASFVDFAEFLFEFRNQFHDALSRLVVRSRQHRRLAILHDLHFEFNALVFLKAFAHSRLI
jgi:hypothetical protein